jgi:hypothetical protein
MGSGPTTLPAGACPSERLVLGGTLGMAGMAQAPEVGAAAVEWVAVDVVYVRPVGGPAVRAGQLLGQDCGAHGFPTSVIAAAACRWSGI